MIYCQNCGNENDPRTNFCRFCGRQFSAAQPQPQQSENNEYNPTRPYMWKTDEFQVKKHPARKTSKIKNVQPLFQPNNRPGSPQPLTYPQPTYLAAGYRCPRCGTTTPPYLKRQISTAGWITFAVLLVM